MGMYQHTDFTGWSATDISPGYWDLWALEKYGFRNDDMSSAIIGENCKVYFYQHADYTGWRAGPIGPGSYSLGALQAYGFVNDDVSSAIIETSWGYKDDSAANKVAGRSSMMTLIGILGCIAVVVAAAIFAIKKVVKRAPAGGASTTANYGVLFTEDPEVAEPSAL